MGTRDPNDKKALVFNFCIAANDMCDLGKIIDFPKHHFSGSCNNYNHLVWKVRMNSLQNSHVNWKLPLLSLEFWSFLLEVVSSLLLDTLFCCQSYFLERRQLPKVWVRSSFSRMFKGSRMAYGENTFQSHQSSQCSGLGYARKSCVLLGVLPNPPTQA